MSARQVAATLAPLQPRCGSLLTLLCVAVACGGGDERPAPPASGASGGTPGGSSGQGASSGDGGSVAGGAAGDGGEGASAASGGSAGGGGTGGSSGSGGFSGGGAGGTSGAGGSAGGGGTAGSGGTGGAGGSSDPVCPNGIAEGDEDCDGADFAGLRCSDFGFDQGDLVCSAECVIDDSGCTGTEVCSDGRDNDGDTDKDCLDADCAAACADDCGNVVTVTLPATIEGTTVGHDASAEASCAAETGAVDVSYRIVAPKSGVLVATLDGNPSLAVALRSACTGGTESACAFDEATTDVTSGEVVFVHVDGNRASTVGSFTLGLVITDALCGNADRDAGEECDDGLSNGLGGCSEMCTVESSEVGDNDTPDTADLYEGVYGGHITSGDVDYVAVAIPADNTGAVIEIDDFGDGGCSAGLQDTYIELIAPDGTTVLASDDDGGDFLCSRLVINGTDNLDAGTYYVRVSAPPTLPNETFPYRLVVNTDRCGNGFRAVMEQCDDGNTASGDSCDPYCRNP